VIGRYSANYGNGVDEIELKQDGSYIHSCHLNNGKELHNTDRWTLHYQGDETRITFNHFAFCLQEYGATPGYWDVKIDKSWIGTLRLSLDPDLGYYYAKQKS